MCIFFLPVVILHFATKKHPLKLLVFETLLAIYSIITTIQFSVKKTTFYNESSFFKIIGDGLEQGTSFHYETFSHTDRSNL